MGWLSQLPGERGQEGMAQAVVETWRDRAWRPAPLALRPSGGEAAQGPEKGRPGQGSRQRTQSRPSLGQTLLQGAGTDTGRTARSGHAEATGQLDEQCMDGVGRAVKVREGRLHTRTSP